MKLNIIDAGLVGLRLSPVLVASHFALQAILNQDTGGVLYLTGLMFTCFIAYLFTSILDKPLYDGEGSPQSLICKSIGIDSFSNISLSQITLNYTLGFFSIAACMGGNMCADRWQPLAFFIFLILSNFILEYRNGCLIASTLFLSGFIGLTGGMSWAGFLKGAGYRNLPLFGGISNKITCAKAQSNIVCKKPQ